MLAWVRLDDQSPRNEKMLKAGPAACWLWVCGIAHCQSQLTDGFVSLEVLPMIGVVGALRVKQLAEKLVAAGLFEKVDGGYRVHHYLDHNPSKVTVLTKRAEDVERKKVGDSLRTPRGIQADSSSPRAGVPSHPIPSVPIPTEKPLLTARSKRPIYTSDRFAVFEWQFDELSKMLGAHFEGFDLHAFFDALTQKSRADGLVIPKADAWMWLQAQVVTEAKRRGFPMAGQSVKLSAEDEAAATLALLKRREAGDWTRQ